MISKNKYEKPNLAIPDEELQELIGDEIKTSKFLEELFVSIGSQFFDFWLTKFPQSTCESPSDYLKLAQYLLA